MNVKDILITWPKSRSLQSYLDELKRAVEEGKVILFRVSTLPKEECSRCYIVHDGMIRGFTTIREYAEVGDNEVTDPITGNFWPAGNYIVRMPYWHDIETEIPMKGFQGYRYIERPCEHNYMDWSETCGCGYETSEAPWEAGDKALEEGRR